MKLILQNSHFKLFKNLSMKLVVLNSYYKFILLKYEKYSHNSYLYEFTLYKYNILVWIKASPKNQKKSLWILKLILQKSHFKLLHLSMKLEVLNSYYKFILLKYEKYSHNSYLYEFVLYKYNILVWIKASPKHQKKIP